MSKWIDRVEEMKRRYRITSDAKAAKALGISQQSMSRIQSKERDMGPITKLILLDKLGFVSLRDALIEILPEPKKELLTKQNK